MPAQRSRTSNWRRCLKQLHERSGALEIAIARDYEKDGEMGRHLVWRVRLLDMTETELVIEQPQALGREIDLHPGVELVSVLSIGQNRWMFKTRTIGATVFRPQDRRGTPALRLEMPAIVERCQRRNYYRVETASLTLPEVDLWPLLDPRSVLVAERANELQYEHDQARARGEASAMGEAMHFEDESVVPEVGPRISTDLLNIGGGGIGLRIRPEDASAVTRHKLFWMRFSLPPALSTPVCATGKLIHTHIDSTQFTYAGMAFDFSFNPAHQRFVVDQICRYIAELQRQQLDDASRAA